MRILLVNWAKIWEGARSGGGVGGYTHDLGIELLRRGHDVSYVFSGHTYVPRPFSRAISEPRVRRIPDYEGMRVFEVVNSPTVAPAFFQFREPEAEASAPALEAEFARFLDVLRPDLVHFNNAEGLSAGCVRVAAARAATVFSLHNYHTLCPQVNLMLGNRRVCTDYRNGHACTTCVNGPSPGGEREHRAMAYRRGFDALHPYVLAERDRSSVRGLSGLRAWLVRGSLAETIALAADPPGYPYPGRDVRTMADLTIDGRRPPRSDRASDEQAIGSEDPAWAPIENVPAADPPATEHPECPENGYAVRRKAMLAALNACHGVHAVSGFVRDKFAAYGVPRARIETLIIGSRMTDLAAEQRAFLLEPPAFASHPDRPIRLAFIGYHNFFKGLHMLADVLEELPEAISRRFHLTVVALQAESIEPRFRKMQPRLAGLTYGYGYRYDEVPRLVAGHDLGVVPSVWWDNGPQTVMEFHACGIPVLAAALGGIPELIRDGVDGLLFRGNDRPALAGVLTSLARDPSVLDRLRQGVRPPKDMRAHAAEMESLFERAAAERAAAAKPEGAAP